MLRFALLQFFAFGFSCLLFGQAQDIYISSRGTNSIKRYDGATGFFIDDFVKANEAGLDRPQEIIWHPDGFMLVTGRGNSALMKFDRTTGAYIGAFTSGYNLDNPTKTKLGPDGLLYVSQWGTVQNKVVRFNYQTGVFIDEFTSVGVPEGMGHAWDSIGNLYVTRWGNGNGGDVWRFDTNGVFVDTFITSGQLQGPVDCWFNYQWELYVVDWSLGDVLKYDLSGNHLSTPYAGLTRAEGYDWDSLGQFYLCDWQSNVVKRFASEGANGVTFINTGGVSNPNDLTFGPKILTGRNSSLDVFADIKVYPNPTDGDSKVHIEGLKNSSCNLKLLTLKGEVLQDHKEWSGDSIVVADLAKGRYIIDLEIGGKHQAHQLIIQ